MSKEIEQEVLRLQNLVQYRNKTKAEISAIAEQKLKEKDVSIEALFDDKKERALAKDLLRKYLEEYTIDTISDKNCLRQLIYLEVYNIRYQNMLNKYHQTDKVAPVNTSDVIYKNLETILKLKSSLGIIHKKEQNEDNYNVLERMKVKFEKYLSLNQASRNIVCPYCGKMVLLKIRTEAWEAAKHPFFQDRILFNKHLVLLYLQNKITKEDVGKILESSSDYVNWLVEKVWKTNPEYKELEKKIADG